MKGNLLSVIFILRVSMLIENKVIIKCRNGNSDAQRELYDQCKNYWFSICLRYLKSREDASDVLQNALVKIFSKLNQFDDRKGSFTSWSSRIVVNESIMYQRKHWKYKDTSDVSLEVVNLSGDPAVYSHLEMEDLTNLIQQLPTGYRIVFNMFVIEGYSHIEIAEKLSISVGTSKSQLFKAKAILKEKIKKSAYKSEKRMAINSYSK